MDVIKSNSVTINQSASDLFNFLMDLKNFKKLMPDNVKSFEVLDDNAVIYISGLGELKLAIIHTSKPSLISMAPQNKVPFKFDIQWNIKELSSHQSEVMATINAELNMMMKLMAEKPLQDFINIQIHKLSLLLT